MIEVLRAINTAVSFPAHICRVLFVAGEQHTLCSYQTAALYLFLFLRVDCLCLRFDTAEEAAAAYDQAVDIVQKLQLKTGTYRKRSKNFPDETFADPEIERRVQELICDEFACNDDPDAASSDGGGSPAAAVHKPTTAAPAADPGPMSAATAKQQQQQQQQQQQLTPAQMPTVLLNPCHASAAAAAAAAEAEADDSGSSSDGASSLGPHQFLSADNKPLQQQQLCTSQQRQHLPLIQGPCQQQQPSSSSSSSS
jgi:hypothetical protein